MAELQGEFWVFEVVVGLTCVHHCPPGCVEENR